MFYSNATSCTEQPGPVNQGKFFKNKFSKWLIWIPTQYCKNILDKCNKDSDELQLLLNFDKLHI